MKKRAAVERKSVAPPITSKGTLLFAGISPPPDRDGKPRLFSGPWRPVLLFLLILTITCFGPAIPAFARWASVSHDWKSVLSLAIDSSGSIYAGTKGGVFKSTNGGSTWIHVKSGPIADVYSLAIDPSGKVYAGTSNVYDYAGRPCGMFKSANGGLTWTPVHSGLTNTHVLSLAIDSSGNIYAGTERGVFKSANEGSSWTPVNSGLTHPYVCCLAIGSSGSVYAGTWSGGVFKSTNGGSSWTAVNSGLPTNVRVACLAIASSGNVYAGTRGSGVFKSTNGGSTWTAVNFGLAVPWVPSLAIDSSGNIYAGTHGGVFKSSNGGRSWTAVNSGLPTNTMVACLVIDSSGNVYAGTRGRGVFKSGPIMSPTGGTAPVTVRVTGSTTTAPHSTPARARATTSTDRECTITQYSIPTARSQPDSITSGPDGALWFTENWLNKIGRITTAGVVTEYPLPTTPTASSQPSSITSGPDGALWFIVNLCSIGPVKRLKDKIGRITTTGVVTEYSVPTPNSRPFSITSGPDGALWFTEMYGNKIGRITTTGVVTEYPLPIAYSGHYGLPVYGGPLGIASGRDGALWFTEAAGNKVGRITTAGVITEYPLPTADGGPYRIPGAPSSTSAIVSGPDGALWFIDRDGNKIGRITTAGVVTEYPVPAALSGPSEIVSGPDGALWFTDSWRNEIGRITTAGAVTEYSIPTSWGGRLFSPFISSSMFIGDIASGPDKALWFTEEGEKEVGKIGRITFGLTANLAIFSQTPKKAK